ncbi:MAG: GNAT family N-acetyltransferase, partial [Xenophilus sp.]
PRAPARRKVRAYLPESRCFVASCSGAVVAACVVKPLGAGAHELMSIAVRPGGQQAGHGTALLRWVIRDLERRGASRLKVGTARSATNSPSISARGSG